VILRLTDSYFLSAFEKLRKATISFVMSVRLSAWNSAPTGRIFIKFDIWWFFGNMPRKFKFQWNRSRIKGTLHEDQYAFFIISRSFLLRMKNVSDKSCGGNQNTHFVFSNFFFPRKSCRLWDVEKYCRAGKATWQYGACELHAGFLWLQIHTLRLWNTQYSSTTIMVARTRLTVTLYAHCLSC
jgi:hypothetical protein